MRRECARPWKVCLRGKAGEKVLCVAWHGAGYGLCGRSDVPRFCQA